jgi:hypothetical protein
MGLDGGKMLVRIARDDPATVRTLEAAAQAVSDLAALGLMAMVEPFMSRREDGRLLNDLSPDAVITSAAIAAGLGTTSRHTWLKLPVVDEMERVMSLTAADAPPRWNRQAGRRSRRLGAGAPLPGCAAWSSGGRCCTRRTTTSPPP